MSTPNSLNINHYFPPVAGTSRAARQPVGITPVAARVPSAVAPQYPPQPGVFPVAQNTADNFRILENNVSSRVHAILEDQTRLLLHHHEIIVKAHLAELQKQSEESYKQLAIAMQQSHKMQIDAASKVASRLKSLDALEGKVTSLDFAVREMLEQLKDPEANLSPRVRSPAVTHEMAVSPIKWAPIARDADEDTGDVTMVSAGSSWKGRRGISDPFVEATLSTATWSPHQDKRPRIYEASIFRPDLSYAGRQGYSIFQKEPTPDGTITSLRRLATGGDGIIEATICSPADLPATPSSNVDPTDKEHDSFSLSAERSVSPILYCHTESPGPDGESDNEELLNISILPSAQHLSQTALDTSDDEQVPGTPNADTPDALPPSEAAEPIRTPSPSSSFIDEVQISTMITDSLTECPPSPLTPVCSPFPNREPSPEPQVDILKVKQEYQENSTREASVGERLRKRPSKAPEMNVRPAKRTKQEEVAGTIKLKTKVKHGKIKVKSEGPPLVKTWPEKVIDGAEDLVGCDDPKCARWFHAGCLGMRQDDPRLHNGKDFFCPACLDPERHPVKAIKDENCARPTCKFPAAFVIEKVIGRRHLVLSGARQYQWLVQWFGYASAEATWEGATENMQPYIDAFDADAKGEGKDPEENLYDEILLKEAIRAGHRYS